MEDVAGYRVLRTAGHGDRATLLLGFDEGETVVLKVAPVDDADAWREIDALERAEGDHVVGLRDVESDARQVVLVLDRLPRGTLAELLERRASLDAGEAVTILAPLAATLDRLHGAGVAHGALSPATVCFADDGAPTLVGFGRAELFAPAAPEVVLDGIVGVAADRQALRVLAESVLARVAGPARRRVDVADASPAALGAALFDLATPAPVRFDADPEERGVERATGVAAEVASEDPDAARLPAWLSSLLPDGIRSRIEAPVATIAAVWASWSPARRRLVLGGAAGALAVLVLVAALPTTPGSDAVAPAPSPSGSLPGVEALPDDPVDAAVLLLRAREECLRDLSLLCLDTVVQPGSAAAGDDIALIRGLQQGGEYPVGGTFDGEPVLVERLGDSALLELPPGSSPASVLLLRTTNGWRLRQYFDDEIVEQYGEAPAVSTGG